MITSSLRQKLMVFVSGRAIALPSWLLFQILIARLLIPKEYAIVGFAIGAAGFVQALTSIGAPQIFSRYLPEAVLTGRYRAACKIVVGGLLLHVILSLATIGLSIMVWGWIAPGSIAEQPVLLISLFVVVTNIYIDADVAAQNFMLQHLSRWVAIMEPIVKLGLLGILIAAATPVTGADILMISVATAGSGTIILLTGVFKFIFRADSASGDPWPSYRQLWSIGLASYLSTLAWLTMNQAMIRLVAASQLDVTSFAGFAFLQALSTLVQRFAPGSILAPFVQPAIMARYTESGDIRSLLSALSIMSKVDAAVIGACIVGVDVAGESVISVLTGGRYADQASITQWFFVLLILHACYRYYEIASVALGVISGLMRTLIIGVVSLCLMVLLGRAIGIWALLFVPLADAAIKLWIVARPIRVATLAHIIDWRQFGAATIVALVLIVVGRWAVHVAAPQPSWLAIAIGAALALIFLAVVGALRPLKEAEAALLARWDAWPVPSLVRRLSRVAN